MTMLAPTVQLAHGATMPILGLGTSPMNDTETERVVADAVQAGYRLIDTAENYGNERGVAAGLRASGVPRADVFVTTKFNKRWHGADLVREALGGSLDRLGLDYVDLLLVHWPNPGQDRYVDAWRGMAKLLDDGLVRAIGTSNFKPAHLQRLLDETGVVPDVNQIQLSPLVTRVGSRAFDEQHGIVTESWSPLGGGRNDVLRVALVDELARKYAKTPGQVVLRWHVQQGLVPIPKSSNPERLRQNLNVFDFDLEQTDMDALSALDQGEASAVDSDKFGH
ncbi:MAG: 2,5-diketo-D-gluconate reductase [Frankiaceae bacterium]|nr:2,5-diketo-D-gluconate reductase [Frankiaceae bacterium]